jgi:hypothetical protein
MPTVLDKIKSAVIHGSAQKPSNRPPVSAPVNKPVAETAPPEQKGIIRTPTQAAGGREPVPTYLQSYDPPSKPSGNRWTEPLKEIFDHAPRTASLEKFNHIYKVEQLVGYLDKEKGKETIRQSLAGILNATNIPAATLVADGKLRRDILDHYLTNSYKEMNARTDDLERQIEAAEKLINDSEKELKVIETRRNNIEKTVEAEKKHIDELLSFLNELPQGETK